MFACAALFATSLTLVSGCTSDRTIQEPSPIPVALSPEADSDGASVFMRGRTEPLAPNRLIVDVVARGAHELHGAAFRVTWNPEALAFVDAKPGDVWSKHGLAKAKEASPGQLAVIWSEMGEQGIDATGETIVGTLTFDSRGHTATPLAFNVERSRLVDKKGVVVAAKWHGGNVGAR